MASLIPPDLVRRAEILSRSHSDRTVCRLLGISRASTFRMKANGWQPAERFRPRRERPTDFAIQSCHMTGEEMARHYGTSTRVITRWRRELIPVIHTDHPTVSDPENFPHEASTNRSTLNVGPRVDDRRSAGA